MHAYLVAPLAVAEERPDGALVDGLTDGVPAFAIIGNVSHLHSVSR